MEEGIVARMQTVSGTGAGHGVDGRSDVQRSGGGFDGIRGGSGVICGGGGE